MLRSVIYFFVMFCVLNEFAFAKALQHKVLSNGMEVYVMQDKSMPLVAHILLYKVGAANEPAGKSGLAHLLEHVMFRSSKNNKDVYQVLQNMGGYFNAFTSSYFTVYYEVVHKKRLADIMRVEADRMRNLDFVDKLFDLEKKIVLEERKMRVDNLPKTRLIEEMQAAFYRNDKSWQVVGWEHEIYQITKDDVKNVYDSFYDPSNAVLVLSGDVSLEQVEPLLVKYYEKIPKTKHKKEHKFLSEPPHLTNTTLTYADSTVKEKELIYFFEAPNIHDKANLPLLIGGYIFASGNTSRLHQFLVVNDPTANRISFDYDPFTYSKAIFSFEIMPKADVDFPKVEDKVKLVVDNLIKDGITEEELEIAKSDFTIDLIQMQDGTTKKGVFMAINLAMGLGPDYISNLPLNISKVTVKEVNEALKTIFINKKYVKGYLLNNEDLGKE